MIVTPGHFKFFIDMLGEAFDFDKKKAQSIKFYDKKAWLTPQEQGEAEYILEKNSKVENKITPTIGPRFRKEHCEITIYDKDGKVLFSNKQKGQKKTG